MGVIPILSTIFLAVVSIVNITLSLAVFRSAPRSATNRIFTLLGLNISIWLIVQFSSLMPGSPSVILWLIRLSNFFATPICSLFLLLAVTIPSEKIELGTKKLLLLLVSTLFIMAISLSPLSFSKVDISGPTPNPTPGPGLLLFLIFVITSSIAVGIVFFKRIRKTVGFEKQQILFLMLGILSMLGLIIITIIIPVLAFRRSDLVPLFPLYTLFFTGATAYAIIKHQLFSMKVIATEALTVTLWTILFTKIFFSPNHTELAIDSVVFALTIIFGILLVKSVRQEVKQKEELQESKEKELAKANQLLKLKDEFVFIATHDLKTPVTAIDGFIDLIQKRREKFSPNTKNSFKAIIEASDRLKQLVNDLLEVSRSDSGTIKVEVKPVNIVEIIKKTIKEITPSANKENITISQKFDSQELVLADEAKLSEVLENLISNAVKYNNKAGKIDVITIRQADKLITKVGDTGVGIPKADQPKIFQKFFRAVQPGTENVTGTGLGLFVTRMLVEKMHGKISFESTEGKGTTFTFELPISHNP